MSKTPLSSPNICRFVQQHAIRQNSTCQRPRNTLGFQKRSHRLPRSDILNGIRRVEIRVRAVIFCCHSQRLLISGGKSPQRMLHPAAKLTQNIFGNIGRALTDKPDTYPFGANQTRNLSDFPYQSLRRIFEQQMRLVKEKRDFRTIRIAYFGKLLEKLRQPVRHMPRYAVDRPGLYVLDLPIR